MTIKRKTHLNLSGSHHTLDSDNGFVGGTLYITGALSASAGVTASIQYVDAVNTPFIVGGANITTNYNSLGQWEITSSGGGGGSNFWTEIDSTNIYTTSSIEVARLSASLGAIITGSILAEGTFSQGNADNNTVSNFSFANGNALSATGTYSHAEGIGGNATNDGAHVEGYSSTASGYASHAEGRIATASGDYSHAEGYNTQAQSNYAHSEGSGSIASGIASHAEGKDAQAQSDYSHAEGLNTVASGYASHAEGVSTTASNFYAHSEGANTTASGLYAHAEGQLATASGQASHAEGYGTTASGQSSHAEGDFTQATAKFAHSEGSGSIALGEYSLAIGYKTYALSTGSLAAGLGTNAYGSIDGIDPPSIVQAAFGKYNTINNFNSLLVVGDGFDNTSRHDVLRVNSGSVQITGSFEVTGTIKFDTINVTPLLATMTTFDGTGTVLSGSLLTSNLANASVGKLDFNVLAASAVDDYASFTFSATIRKDQSGSTLVLAATELDSIYEGANASGWDVNINNNGDIICTGSLTVVHWYAQVTKKMILSGSGTVLY